MRIQDVPFIPDPRSRFSSIPDLPGPQTKKKRGEKIVLSFQKYEFAIRVYSNCWGVDNWHLEINCLEYVSPFGSLTSLWENTRLLKRGDGVKLSPLAGCSSTNERGAVGCAANKESPDPEATSSTNEGWAADGAANKESPDPEVPFSTNEGWAAGGAANRISSDPEVTSSANDGWAAGGAANRISPDPGATSSTNEGWAAGGAANRISPDVEDISSTMDEGAEGDEFQELEAITSTNEKGAAG